jgi:acetyltransferase-like isoleucine patch superfamily enzyme
MSDRPLSYEVIDRERHGGSLKLGRNVSIGRRASLDTSADITLRDGAVISEDVLVLTHDHDPQDISSTLFSPLVVGKGAWVGARAIVLPSCMSIGDGAVVGAGSVVTHDVPAHELWAGNPARFVRKLCR